MFVSEDTFNGRDEIGIWKTLKCSEENASKVSHMEMKIYRAL